MRRLLNANGVAWICEQQTMRNVDGRAVLRCTSVFNDVRLFAPVDWHSAWSDDLLIRAIGDAVRRVGMPPIA